jgi:hypothetical protein
MRGSSLHFMHARGLCRSRLPGRQGEDDTSPHRGRWEAPSSLRKMHLSECPPVRMGRISAPLCWKVWWWEHEEWAQTKLMTHQSNRQSINLDIESSIPPANQPPDPPAQPSANPPMLPNIESPPQPSGHGVRRSKADGTSCNCN